MPRQSSLLIGLLVAAVSAPCQSKEIRLLFTGDILLSRQVAVELESRKISPWTGFGELFRNADWVGGNFEGALGSECQPNAKPCFATSDSAVALMKSAGFSTVTAENNHSGDASGSGRDHTHQAFRDASMLALDFERSPQFMRFGEVTVGIVAVTLIKAADGRVQQIPSVELAQKLRLANRLSNFVIVSIHWGNELQDWPSELQREQARWLVAHGAGLILGHHPHVIQTPECVDGKPVFYSLGNHVFDQKYPETKQGLIADCRISKGTLHCEGLTTDTSPGSSIPLLKGSETRTNEALRTCRSSINSDLVMNGFQIRPEPWAADQPSETVMLTGWSGGKLIWRSRRQRILSLQLAPMAADQTPLLFSLERHNSPMDNENGVRPYVYDVGPAGLIARWRGTALAWPLLDAIVEQDGTVCALHRGDSFAVLNRSTKETRIAAYRWNGFGFTGLDEAGLSEHCRASLR